jgi:formate dehydrogenase iron-sulfur subunit
MPTVVNNVETLCNIPLVARAGAAYYDALSPDAQTSGSKLVCFNERFARPGVYEVRFGTTLRELCEDVAGGLVDGHAIKALQIGGPLGGILPGWRLDTPFDFDALAAEGCMLGHGGIVAFDDTVDMARMARFAMEFCALESCGKCTPCRIGSTRGVEVIDRIVAGEERDKNFIVLDDLCETLLDGSLCALGGLTPFPVQSALKHFPEDFHRAPRKPARAAE